MQNGASLYSNPCNSVNTVPRIMVMARAQAALFFLLFIMA